MGLDEFFDYLRRFPIDKYVVHLKYKHDKDSEWEESNEILEVDENFNYVWQDDWWEGQKYVRVLGFDAVGDLNVNGFPIPDDPEKRRILCIDDDEIHLDDNVEAACIVDWW